MLADGRTQPLMIMDTDRFLLISRRSYISLVIQSLRPQR